MLDKSSESRKTKQNMSLDNEAGGDLTIALNGCVVVITLNRGRALNALTEAMRGAIAAAMPDFARNPQVYAVIIRSTSPKAFSAGSDVREIVALAKTDRALALRAFADEYRLNWLMECFSKPTISLIDGMVMGGGVGISGFGTHRVAGENYSWAMPETMIGLFPDIGAVHTLARLGPVGQYLGLTGRSIKRADAFRLGLATHCIAAEHFAQIEQELALANPVDPLLDGLHADPGPGDLEAHDQLIAEAFSAGSVEDVIAKLEASPAVSKVWAQEVVSDLRKRSPTSLKVTHRHILEAGRLDIRQTLTADYRLVARFLEGQDFYEGARAALIDKDGRPRWQPPALDGVGGAALDAYFAPLPAGQELELPTREEMQKARV